MKLRWHGGGIRMCRMLLKRRKSDLFIYILDRIAYNLEQYKVVKKRAKLSS
jgi:hypothetical protein